MNYSTITRAGDLAQLVGLTHKHFIFILQPGGEFQSHRGVVKHDDLIGKPWGSQVFSHTGAPFFLLQPSLADIMNELPRTTQILYPKDIGYILIQMGVSEGQTVMEAGTGSGSMTIALASAVGATGRVISYEQKSDVQNLALKNLERVGLASPSFSTCKIRSITFRRCATHSSRVDFLQRLSRPSTKWKKYCMHCAPITSRSWKSVNCCCVITKPTPAACVPPTAWWRTLVF